MLDRMIIWGERSSVVSIRIKLWYCKKISITSSIQFAGNILGEYSLFVKPSTWNYLHLTWINMYRNDRKSWRTNKAFRSLHSSTKWRQIASTTSERSIACKSVNSSWTVYDGFRPTMSSKTCLVGLSEQGGCILLYTSGEIPHLLARSK